MGCLRIINKARPAPSFIVNRPGRRLWARACGHHLEPCGSAHTLQRSESQTNLSAYAPGGGGLALKTVPLRPGPRKWLSKTQGGGGGGGGGGLAVLGRLAGNGGWVGGLLGEGRGVNAWVNDYPNYPTPVFWVRVSIQIQVWAPLRPPALAQIQNTLGVRGQWQATGDAKAEHRDRVLAFKMAFVTLGRYRTWCFPF